MEADWHKIDIVMQKFADYCLPKDSESMNHLTEIVKQAEGESTVKHIPELRKLAASRLQNC